MKKIIVSLLILSLSACGWHIRGSVKMPPQLTQLYVSAIDSKGALISELRQLLKTNHIAIADDVMTANYSLHILEETKDKRSAGVGGDALSSSYEITLKADYEIHVKNSNQITKDTAIVVRSYNYNTASINSATQEEVLLDQEMRRDLAQQMLRRLSAVVANPQSEQNHSDEHKNGKTAP